MCNLFPSTPLEEEPVAAHASVVTLYQPTQTASLTTTGSWRCLPLEIRTIIYDLYIEDLLQHARNHPGCHYTNTQVLSNCIEAFRAAGWYNWLPNYARMLVRSTCDFQAMDQLQNFCEVATDMHEVILGLCYKKFGEINACLDASEHSGLGDGSEPWAIEDALFRRDVLGGFFWYARANLKLGSLTLSPETGALVVYMRESCEDGDVHDEDVEDEDVENEDVEDEDVEDDDVEDDDEW